jgi:hypothetical protein
MRQLHNHTPGGAQIDQSVHFSFCGEAASNFVARSNVLSSRNDDRECGEKNEGRTLIP